MVAFQKLNGSTKMGILNYLRNMNMLFMQGIWRKDTPSKWNAISSATIDEKIGLSGVSDFSKEILNRDKTAHEICLNLEDWKFLKRKDM